VKKKSTVSYSMTDRRGALAAPQEVPLSSRSKFNRF